ncbi:MAG: TonB-dependent receptor, partial [Halioglobus sp.]|nr:TonB-dependent receptor [Halioglobus sp.]
TDFFSQEFRLISPSYDKYDYLVGLYYADAKTDRQFVRNPGTTILTSNWDATAETESMAVFGQLNWHFTPDTTLTAGLRWNDEKISIDYINNLAATDGVARNHDSDSAAVGNLSVQHNLQEDVMVYARYAKGYKGQAYNVVTGFTQADADDPVDPETSDAYEIGIKSQFWDQRMQLNATVFYTEYQDFQAQNTVITPGGTFVNKLRNVGEVETQGVELEGVALLGENLTLTFGAAYVDSEIKSFEGAPCYEGQTVATGCVNDTQNLDGEPLPNSPEWKYNLMANYHIELDSLPFYGFVNAGYTWQDDVNFDIKQNPLTVQDSYGVAMASIGISEKTTDQYRVTLFVNNLTDENYRAGIADVRDLFGGDLALGQVLPRSAQRYYGVRLRYSF